MANGCPRCTPQPVARLTGTFSVVCECRRVCEWPESSTQHRCECGLVLVVPALPVGCAAEPFKVMGWRNELR